MFVSVKKIVSAFETRRQPRPLSHPPSLPHSFPSKLSPHRSPRNSPQLPSTRSTSPGHLLTNPSPYPSPPISRSSSAPSSPTLRRTTCLSVSSSSVHVPPPLVLRSSHPNLHLSPHKTPPHKTPPAPSSWPRHPTTPPAFPRQLKVPGGSERQREEGPASAPAWVRVRDSWPSSHGELWSCGRQRFSEVTERRSPCASISCERMGQMSCRESTSNIRNPCSTSVSLTPAVSGTTVRGIPGERETSNIHFSRLKTHAPPSSTPNTGPTELTTSKKQNQIHIPTLPKGYMGVVPSQSCIDPGAPPILEHLSCGTHRFDHNIERDICSFTPIKTGGFQPPFLDFGQAQCSLTSATTETKGAAYSGPNSDQSQGCSGCLSLRAHSCYCISSPIDRCDRQTQTQGHNPKECDVVCPTGSAGCSYISKEVQTLKASSAVGGVQLIPSMALNPIQISASSPFQSPGLNSSSASSSVDTGQNPVSWVSPVSFTHGQNCGGGSFQTQDHNGNQVCLPNNLVNLGCLTGTVESHNCLVSHESNVGSSFTCTYPPANPAASVIGAAQQSRFHTTAPMAALQSPVHTTATGAALQTPVHTTLARAALQTAAHTTGADLQSPVHTTAAGAALQTAVHTTVAGAALQTPDHTTAAGQKDIKSGSILAHLNTKQPPPQGTETTVHRPKIKPHVEGNEPKEPKPVPVSLTRNSDKAFLSLLLFIHSGSSNSMIAIDNKIEQAMDLVKTHLMMAVREEVEVLREQIKELAERNAQLERENYILRALRDRD